MPTIDRVDGLRVVIYPNDHRPAHVHVIGNGREAVFDLDGPQGRPELRENYGFSRADVNRIQVALAKRRARLYIEWGRIHGDYH